MKAIIYARFSPRPDADESESCERQESMCREYCAKKGYEVVDYKEDRALSGDDADRPGLWQAVESLRRGWVLVVRDRKRLARDVYLSEVIERAVAKAGAKIDAIEGGNGDSPQDRLVRQILAAMAEYEKKVNAYRTKYGMLRHQAAGRRMSRFAPYGWSVDPDDPSLLIANEEERGVVELMRELQAGGMSLRGIAAELDKRKIPPKAGAGLWSHKTIDKILKRGA